MLINVNQIVSGMNQLFTHTIVEALKTNTNKLNRLSIVI